MTLREIIENVKLRRKMEKRLGEILNEGTGFREACARLTDEIVREEIEKGNNIIFPEE